MSTPYDPVMDDLQETTAPNEKLATGFDGRLQIAVPAHTPLPWETGNQDKWIYAEGAQNPIAMLENPEDAKLIVAAVNHAERLADDMREIRDMAAKRSRVNMQNGVSLEAFARCSLAQWELAQ